MRKEYICISCPIGCHLNVNVLGQQLSVEGNKCVRGEIYAKEEYFSPKRVVTATCQTNSKEISRAPIKTDKPIGKEHINDLLVEIYKIELKCPVKNGYVVLKDYKNTGVNVVVTRTIEN